MLRTAPQIYSLRAKAGMLRSPRETRHPPWAGAIYSLSVRGARALPGVGA